MDALPGDDQIEALREHALGKGFAEAKAAADEARAIMRRLLRERDEAREHAAASDRVLDAIADVLAEAGFTALQERVGAALLRITELDTERDEARTKLIAAEGRCRRAAQVLIEQIGSVGAENVDETAVRAVQKLAAAEKRIAELETEQWLTPPELRGRCDETPKPKGQPQPPMRRRKTDMTQFTRLLASLLCILAALPATDPKRDLGGVIATTVVAEGVLTLHERGMVLAYPDATELVASFATVEDPLVLVASWQSQGHNGVPITITVTYTLPVNNPTEHQMTIYAERHRRMVVAQQIAFPPIATN